MYMNDQPELTTHDRSIVVDWLIEIHMDIPGLVPESLYLCINIIDRFLSRQCVPRKRMQLLGVTSLLIACKYEETQHISISDFTYFIDILYTRQDVLTMELLIVKVLDYRLTIPTGYAFLQRFLYITEASSIASNLATFYMERMLLDYEALELRPSHVAAAAVTLALNNPDLPENELQYYAVYTVVPAPGVVRCNKAPECPVFYISMLTYPISFPSPRFYVIIQGFHSSKS
jgi:hypothetical protein